MAAIGAALKWLPDFLNSWGKYRAEKERHRSDEEHRKIEREQDELDQLLRKLVLDDTRMQREGATEEWLSAAAIELEVKTDALRGSVRRLKNKGLFPWETHF